MTKTIILSYLASGNGEGKFIQFTLGGREYLVFAPRELHRFHNQILAHFLAERRLPHRWNNEHLLEIEAPDLTVIGGGKFRVNTEMKTLKLWDDSQIYGRFDERGLAQRIGTADHPWSGYLIQIV
ncbi:MAG TPA: hypothetical protein VEI74_14520 [Candidatus Methylomirabilis sp.]|nr:hypothetical protein [Candidatus Methylomirabilis sp.]